MSVFIYTYMCIDRYMRVVCECVCELKGIEKGKKGISD